jgi:hypothetical protein
MQFYLNIFGWIFYFFSYEYCQQHYAITATHTATRNRSVTAIVCKWFRVLGCTLMSQAPVCLSRSLLRHTSGLTLSPPAVESQCLSEPGVPAPCEKFPHTVDNF